MNGIAVCKAGEYAADKLASIKWWQFWRKDEEEFWVGMLAASTAAMSGSSLLEKVADDIFEKHKSKVHKWVKPNGGR